MPSFRTRLINRERLIGTLVTLPSPEIAEICADAGFDWLFLDMEHSPLDAADVQRIAQAVQGRCACIVRVPTGDAGWLKKVLDTGVDGIIVPLVNSADEARRLASLVRYPPQGTRSVGMARAHRYGPGFQAYVERANRDVTLILQVEHIEAVRNVDAILAVPGIDAILIGPYDLSASLNKPGQIADDDVQAAIAQVKHACDAKGMPIGIFCGDVARGQIALEQGFTLLPVGLDAALFSAIASQTVTALRNP